MGSAAVIAPPAISPRYGCPVNLVNVRVDVHRDEAHATFNVMGSRYCGHPVVGIPFTTRSAFW